VVLLLGLFGRTASVSAEQAIFDRFAEPCAGPEIRISGSPADRSMIEALETGYRDLRPDVKFSNSLFGPESTVAGIYTGTADLAFMARELREPMERMAFQWVRLTPPFSVPIANGPLSVSRPSTQIAVYVHADNPLKTASLAVLDAIFGAEHKRGDRLIRHWGDLGLENPWQDLPIKVLGPDPESIDAVFFRRRVLQDSHKWNRAYEIFADGPAILKHLRDTPGAIAIAPLSDHMAGVRALAVSTAPGRQAWLPEQDAITEGRYPLGRVVSVALYRVPEKPIAAACRRFLDYVLSVEGQAVLKQHSHYLPLGVKQRQHSEALVQ